MLLKQFYFEDLKSEESDIISSFIEWLWGQMFQSIDNKLIKRKIQLRLNYIYTVSWISWIGDKYINTKDIMNAIYASLSYKVNKKGIWKMEVTTDALIPNSITPLIRLLRFLNYGDVNHRGIGLFTNLINHYDANTLNRLWQIYAMKNLGYMVQSTIIIL